MSTKYKMRYGQYTSEEAKRLSIDYLGTVVYSGRTREIWVDGKCIAANFSQSVKDLRTYVDEQIAKILGSEGLEKTLDTIKEIQDELLKNINYTVAHDLGNSEVEYVSVIREEYEGSEDVAAVYRDEELNVVATEDKDGNIVYEEGYGELERENVIDALMEKINENKNQIDILKNKGFVANISSDESGLVTTEVEETTDEDGVDSKNYTIGVKVGNFKTGRGDVLNPESTAYTDGIATVKDVQDYIEERMVWDEFVSSADDIADDINNTSDSDYDIQNDAELDDNMIFG